MGQMVSVLLIVVVAGWQFGVGGLEGAEGWRGVGLERLRKERDCAVASRKAWRLGYALMFSGRDIGRCDGGCG